MPRSIDPIAAKTIDLVQQAVDAGIAKPAWLDSVRDGTVSGADKRAARNLKKEYVASGLAKALSALMSMGKYGMPDRYDSLIKDLIENIDAQVAKQGFLKTFAEGVRDAGRGSMVIPK